MSKRLLAGIAFLVSISASTSSWAAQIPANLQVELQSVMLEHIESIVVDGAYTYVDTTDDAIKTVYPANVHPLIIPFGDDYFVCSEMIDEEGNKFTADFLVRTIMNDRESVSAAISKLGR